MQQIPAVPPATPGRGQSPCYIIERRHRYWQILDPLGELVCLTVYKRGVEVVVRRLTGSAARATRRLTRPRLNQMTRRSHGL